MAGKPEQFTHGGRNIHVEFKNSFSEDDYTIIGDFLEGISPRPMTARTVAVIRGADKLRIDGKEFNLNNRKKPFPRIKDEESGLTLMEALVKRLVAREPSLAEDEPFSVAFADYAPDDPEEGEDPLDGRTSGYGEGPAG